jgi:hypothetical protein
MLPRFEARCEYVSLQIKPEEFSIEKGNYGVSDLKLQMAHNAGA